MQKRGGGQGGCEPRIELIVKFKKKSGGGPAGRGWVGHCGCEPRIEVFVKMKIKSGVGVRSGGGSGSG